MTTQNRKKLAALSIVSTLVLAANAYAGTDNVKIVGTIDGYISAGPHSTLSPDIISNKPILFQKIQLSPAAKAWLAKHADSENETHLLAGDVDAPLPKQVELGMNNVPVLDQGRHGTCVTFATSGALDAALGSEDYISQLCNLELGTYLESQGSTPYSGWDGSWGDIVLKQIKDFGIINIASQRKDGCSGVYEYPRDDANKKGKPMPTEEFIGHSEKIMDNISFVTLSTHEDAFSDKADVENVLLKVKSALNKGHRVTFGTLLDVNVGYNGALGTYKVSNDTWMLTPQISKDAKAGSIDAGHEMIITGYDDNAVVMGPNHTRQIGVLTLRNSWGNAAGDHGNYYMTYAHFRVLAMESYELIPASK